MMLMSLTFFLSRLARFFAVFASAVCSLSAFFFSNSATSVSYINLISPPC
jgi:hypothetical protein